MGNSKLAQQTHFGVAESADPLYACSRAQNFSRKMSTRHSTAQEKRKNDALKRIIATRVSQQKPRHMQHSGYAVQCHRVT